jgi:cell division protein FtsI/penicillin-binding protein 2
MALVVATLANDGRMPAPRLTLREAHAGGEAGAILTPAESGRLLRAWRLWEAAPSSEGRAKGHWGVALAGEGEPHAWFMGIAPATGQPAYAIAVLIERAANPETAVDVGVALLQAAIEE